MIIILRMFSELYNNITTDTEYMGFRECLIMLTHYGFGSGGQFLASIQREQKGQAESQDDSDARAKLKSLFDGRGLCELSLNAGI